MFLRFFGKMEWANVSGKLLATKLKCVGGPQAATCVGCRRTGRPSNKLDLFCGNCGVSAFHHRSFLDRVLRQGEACWEGLHKLDQVVFAEADLAVADGVRRGSVVAVLPDGVECVDTDGNAIVVRNPVAIQPLSCPKFQGGYRTPAGESHPACHECYEQLQPERERLADLAIDCLRSGGSACGPTTAPSKLPKRARVRPSKENRNKVLQGISDGTIFDKIRPSPDDCVPSDQIVEELRRRGFKLEYIRKHSGLPRHAEAVAKTFKMTNSLLHHECRFPNRGGGSILVPVAGGAALDIKHMPVRLTAEVLYQFERLGQGIHWEAKGAGVISILRRDKSIAPSVVLELSEYVQLLWDLRQDVLDGRIAEMPGTDDDFLQACGRHEESTAASVATAAIVAQARHRDAVAAAVAAAAAAAVDLPPPIVAQKKRKRIAL